MKLYYREMGQGQPLVILHGLFGSSDNWLSIGKVLAEHYHVYLVDQRNHGQSPHSDIFSYDAMATDLEGFFEDVGLNKALLMGHSMGGKTAMLFTTRHPEKVEKLIVVDIAPKDYPVHHDTILDGLNALALDSLQSRNEADALLSHYVPELGVRQFLLKNLARTDKGFEWKINLPVITASIDIIGEGLDEGDHYEGPVLFIDGEKSNYIKEGDAPLIHAHFPKANIVTIRGAGHWVHAEKPEEFLQTVQTFLSL
jgi:esterase